MVAPWREALAILVTWVGGLGVFEEVGYFFEQGWEVVLDDIPDCAVGYVVVFVDYSASESDDCFVVGDPFRDGLIVVGESFCGFAEDFELALDCGAQKLIFFVLFEGDFSGVIDALGVGRRCRDWVLASGGIPTARPPRSPSP